MVEMKAQKVKGKAEEQKREQKRKGRKSETQRRIKEFSLDVLSKATDLTLFLILYNLEYAFGGSRGGKAAWRAKEKAFEDLEGINYETLRNAFHLLKRRGLVRTVKDETLYRPLITKAGKKRLQEILPDYDEERIWDGRLYLVTYDIPEEKKGDREILRSYLKKIGCGGLQRSVFLTPYNPKGTLEEFVGERELKASIIISDMGKDGSIGEKDIKTLVREVYRLDDLNDDYLTFISKFKDAEKGTTAALKACFTFVEILERDPQLPFELLPSNWVGDAAYEIFRELKEGN
jgi:phenylacetic acid degradation operon negative regulatory protein